MRKIKVAMLVMFLFIGSASFISADEGFHFKETRWGMSVEEVEKIESETLIDKSKESLLYRTKIAGLENTLGYLFINDKLYTAAYQFTKKHTNPDNYVNDYLKLKKLLEKKYGEPKIDKVRWTNDTYKMMELSYGIAIGYGYLSLGCIWEDDETEINLYLSGGNFKYNFLLQYKSKELAVLQNKKDEKSTLDQL